MYKIELAGRVARMEEGGSAFKILRGKPTGKKHSGRHWPRWEVNIRNRYQYEQLFYNNNNNNNNNNNKCANKLIVI